MQNIKLQSDLSHGSIAECSTVYVHFIVIFLLYLFYLLYLLLRCVPVSHFGSVLYKIEPVITPLPIRHLSMLSSKPLSRRLPQVRNRPVLDPV